MIEKASKRYEYVQACAETDSEFTMLRDLLNEGEPAFHKMLDRLSEEDRETILSRICLIGEIDERILEIACFAP